MNKDVIRHCGWGVSESYGRPIFFFMEENWNLAMTRVAVYGLFCRTFTQSQAKPKLSFP